MPSPLKFGFGGWAEKPQLVKKLHYRNKFLARLPSDKWFKKVFKPDAFEMVGSGLDTTLYANDIYDLQMVFTYYTEGHNAKNTKKKFIHSLRQVFKEFGRSAPRFGQSRKDGY